MQIIRVVSGGQTGADRGGLDAAIVAGIPHGGWCPKGRRAEDGGMLDEYDLTETESEDYEERTERNVEDSDATVIFTMGELDGGSLLTAEMADKHGRPWLHVDLGETTEEDAARRVAAWLKHLQGDLVLNVAGQRESKSPGIGEAVKRVMSTILREIDEPSFATDKGGSP